MFTCTCQLSIAHPKKAAIRSRYNLPNPPREPRTRLREGRRPGMGTARGMTRLNSLKIVGESFRRARLTPQFNSEGPHIYPLLAFLPIDRSSHSLLLTQTHDPIFHQKHLQNACYRAPHYQGYGRSQLVRCCVLCIEPKADSIAQMAGSVRSLACGLVRL